MSDKELIEKLHYDPETGIFTWKISKAGIKKGSVAGTQLRGYVRICIDSKCYFAHRLAWLYMMEKWPDDQIDHINRDRSDNRWVNLRQADAMMNCRNSVRNNEFLGVYWHKHSQKWAARSARIGGKIKNLGTFNTNLCACYARWAYDNR